MQNHTVSLKKTAALNKLAAIFNMAVPKEPYTPCATSEGGKNTWNIKSKGENTTTHHTPASGTWAKSEGEHQDKNSNKPRARTKETTPDGTPRHPIQHRGNITKTAPIWWKHVQLTTGTQIKYQVQTLERAQYHSKPCGKNSAAQTNYNPSTNQQ